MKNKPTNLIEIIDKFYNNDDACAKYFLDLKYKDGFTCKKCGCNKFTYISKKAYQCNNYMDRLQ
jgi:hypothetical protein